MATQDQTVELTVSEAACLDAVRSGLETKTPIAVEARLDLRTVAAALESLRSSGLVSQQSDTRWRATDRGQSCPVQLLLEQGSRRGPKKLNGVVPGTAAERLLASLNGPKSGPELVEFLGVTSQRVHQLVIRLYAQGHLKLADRAHPLHLFARADDPSVLLTRDAERVLSALPDEEATTEVKLRAAAPMSVERIREALDRLIHVEFVEETGSKHRGRLLYQLTPKGCQHFQRRVSVRRAEPPALPVRSDRVRDVMACIANKKEARIMEVRDELGIPHASINALMQYLKRKGLVRKEVNDLKAPYQLTTEGHEALSRMLRNDA